MPAIWPGDHDVFAVADGFGASLENKELRMDVTLSARHMDLSDATKDYIRDKVSRIDRALDQITEVKAVVCKEHTGFSFELVAVIPNHANIVITRQSENLYGAVDEAVATCERKLRQFKDKRQHRKGHLHDLPEQA